MKKIMYILIIIILIVGGYLLAKNIMNNPETVETSKNFNNVVENKNVNKIENEITNEILNNIVENNIIENKQNENKKEEEHPTVQEEENNKQDEQNLENKAIEIAKNDWGTDASVYFSYEYKDDNGRYVVSVRKKSTTKAEFWYTIDMETGKIVD